MCRYSNQWNRIEHSGKTQNPYGNLVNCNISISGVKMDFSMKGKTLGSYLKKIKIKSYFKIKTSDEANILHLKK